MATNQPKHLKIVKIFIGSPGDLDKERQLFRDAISKVNDIKAKPQGRLLEAVGWEDTLLGKGRPQAKINADLVECDLAVMLLWKRWGSQTGEYSSGFEEEFEVGRAEGKDIFFYFKSIPEDMLIDPGEHLQQVIAFRKKIEAEKEYFYRPYEEPETWRHQFEKDLCNWLDELPPEELNLDVLREKARRFDDLSDAFDQLGSENIQLISNTINIAWEYANSGKLTEAEEQFIRALVIQRTPNAINNYGLFLQRIGLLEKAEIKFRELAEVGIRIGNKSACATAYSNLGTIFQTHGDLEEASKLYKNSLTFYNELNQRDGVATIYNNLGSISKIRGDLDEAEKMILQSFEIFKEIDDQECLAAVLCNLGSVYNEGEQLDKAEKILQESISLSESIGLKEPLTDAYSILGIIHAKRNNLVNAEQMFSSALALNMELGHKEGMADNYGNLGNIYAIQNKLDAAEDMYLRNLHIETELHRKRGIGSCFLNMANVKALRGEKLKAIEMYRKALELFTEIGIKSKMDHAKAMIRVLSQEE